MMWIKRIRSLHRRTAIALLLSILLVVTVSAAVYYSMNIRNITAISKPGVAFATAADSTSAGATVVSASNNTFARMTGIKAYPNATSIYEQALAIVNLDGNAHSIKFRGATLGSALSTNYNTIVFKVVDSTSAVQGSQTVTYTGGSATPTMGNSAFTTGMNSGVTWYVRVEATAIASNTLPATSTTIDLYIDVS